jgi:hypothetical protein
VPVLSFSLVAMVLRVILPGRYSDELIFTKNSGLFEVSTSLLPINNFISFILGLVTRDEIFTVKSFP